VAAPSGIVERMTNAPDSFRGRRHRVAHVVAAPAALLGVILAGCGRSAPTPPPAPAPDPAPDTAADTVAKTGLEFEKRVHDFGTIWDVEQTSCTFPFVNRGTTPITITAIRASCGCTATSLDKMDYAPGEGGEIDVSFMPKGFGRQTKGITVMFARPTRMVELSIKADIRQFVRVEPANLGFGVVALGAPHSRRFTLTSSDPDLVIEGVFAGGGFGSSGRALSARIVESPGVGSVAGGEVVVEATLSEDTVWGAYYGWVEVQTLGRVAPGAEQINHTVRVNVSARVFGTIHASEPMFRVEVVAPGESFERGLRLSNPDGVPFEVTGVEVVGSRMPGITARAERATDARGGYKITLAGDSGTYLGNINGQVIIHTNIPGEEELTIQFAGIVR